MSRWKVKFLVEAWLGSRINLHNSHEVIEECAKLAYKDMLTGGRFYYDKLNEMLVEEEDPQTLRCQKLISLLEENNYIFSRDLVKNVSMLFGHKEIITKPRPNNKNNYVTRFGLAQKFVNMMFKYLYVLSDCTGLNINFSNCDCPLDSRILQKLTPLVPKELRWTKLDYKSYIYCQDVIKAELKKMTVDEELKKLGNLAYDFLFWSNQDNEDDQKSFYANSNVVLGI